MGLGDHVVLKSHSRGFHTRWRMEVEDQGYGCKYPGSDRLRPVPPGETRASMGYGDNCRAEICLWAQRRGSWVISIEKQDDKQKYDVYRANCRARGLNTNREPLKRSCWNCIHVRTKLSGYVCKFEPEARPRSWGSLSKMRKKAEACPSFEWRLVEAIPDISEEKVPL
jgi:hypothetical protein